MTLTAFYLSPRPSPQNSKMLNMLKIFKVEFEPLYILVVIKKLSNQEFFTKNRKTSQ